MSASATGTGKGAFLVTGRLALQLPFNRLGTGLMHGGANCHLNRFQIQTTGAATPLKKHVEKLVQFACDFELDRVRRFFPGWKEPENLA